MIERGTSGRPCTVNTTCSCSPIVKKHDYMVLFSITGNCCGIVDDELTWTLEHLIPPSPLNTWLLRMLVVANVVVAPTTWFYPRSRRHRYSKQVWRLSSGAATDYHRMIVISTRTSGSSSSNAAVVQLSFRILSLASCSHPWGSANGGDCYIICAIDLFGKVVSLMCN